MLGLKFEGNTKLRVSRWGALCGVFAMLVFVTGCPPPPPSVCQGVDVDDGDACTIDECTDVEGEPVVTHTPVECDPGLTCVDGDCVDLCEGVECDDGNVCTDDSCDTATGDCVYTNNTAECDDADACTENDVCADGACAGTPIDCGDDDACTDDTCVDGLCEHSPTVCDDANLCTADSCDIATGCVFDPKDCDDADNCTTDSCDPATGDCVNAPVECPAGQECDPATGTCVEACVTDADCDDQNPCTTDECTVDGCVNTPVECAAGESCNPATGDCETIECANDADCNDGYSCTKDDCDLGADPPECVYTNTDADCNDGQFCNGTETCDPTNPDAEEDTGCVIPGDPCLAINKVCDEANNDCRDCENDGECDDGYECTEDDCIAGSCNNAPVDANCDDGLFCTDDDFCDPAHADADETTGCVNETDPCDCAHASDPCEGALGDRKLCTEADGGDCLDCGNDTDCDDGILCTADDCTVATGVCTNSEEDDMCPDPVFCDGPDFCDPTNVDADFNGCVQPGNVCVNPDPICSEADDECQVCISHAECDEFWVDVDEVDCTDARCDAGGACVDFPNDDNCDDGVFCNGAETCDALLDCQAGVPETCDDADACTADSCNVANDECDNDPIPCTVVGDCPVGCNTACTAGFCTP